MTAKSTNFEMIYDWNVSKLRFDYTNGENVKVLWRIDERDRWSRDYSRPLGA